MPYGRQHKEGFLYAMRTYLGAKRGLHPALSSTQVERMIEEIRSTCWPLSRIAHAYGISKTAMYNYCPGGRAGLAERDLAKNEVT